jgi:hypothetical protein
MADPNTVPHILWDTLNLSGRPLRGRCDILVVGQVKARKRDRRDPDDYRINFELNQQHGLVSYDAEVLDTAGGAGNLRWRYLAHHDLIVAIRDHFLTTQLYGHLAHQLGWPSHPSP